MPTVLELAARGLAFRLPVTGSIYRMTPEGHTLLGEIMRRNGERWKHWGRGERAPSGN